MEVLLPIVARIVERLKCLNTEREREREREVNGTISRVEDLIWVIFFRLASVYYIFYVILQSFMSSEQSVK